MLALQNSIIIETGPPASVQESLLDEPNQILSPNSRLSDICLAGQTVQPENNQPNAEYPEHRRTKRVKLLLDVRTELTDEELKVIYAYNLHSCGVIHFSLKSAREKYVEGQRSIKLEMERRKLEREGNRILEELIYGVPDGR